MECLKFVVFLQKCGRDFMIVLYIAVLIVFSCCWRGSQCLISHLVPAHSFARKALHIKYYRFDKFALQGIKGLSEFYYAIKIILREDLSVFFMKFIGLCVSSIGNIGCKDQFSYKFCIKEKVECIQSNNLHFQLNTFMLQNKGFSWIS